MCPPMDSQAAFPSDGCKDYVNLQNAYGRLDKKREYKFCLLDEYIMWKEMWNKKICPTFAKFILS